MKKVVRTMRKKHWKILLWLMIGLPLIAVAKEEDPGFISFSYIWVAFASIHWTAGVFSPIAKMKVKDETEKKETIKIISILFRFICKGIFDIHQEFILLLLFKTIVL